MSEKRRRLGKQGEEIAAKFLHDKGYEILGTNLRFGKAEVDILAAHHETLVIVEVKTRSTDYFGDPQSFVDHRKEDMLRNAAETYIEQSGWQGEVRFDIIGLVFGAGQTPSLFHLEDVF